MIRSTPLKSTLKQNLFISTSPKSGSPKKEIFQNAKTLKDLLKNGLKSIYTSEKYFSENLVDIIEAAYCEEVQDSFLNLLQKSSKHCERLLKVFPHFEIGEEITATNTATTLIMGEAKTIVLQYEEGAVRDSALISEMQKIKQLHIAQYRSLCELCEVLGYYKIGERLDKNLAEEEVFYRDLSERIIVVNHDAYKNSVDEFEGDN